MAYEYSVALNPAELEIALAKQPCHLAEAPLPSSIVQAPAK